MIISRSAVSRLTIALLLLLSAPLEAALVKIATLAPEGSIWMKHMRSGAKEISERTEGRVTIKFYGGGVMGNDKKVMRKIRIGQLHGGVFTPSAITARYSDLLVYGLPLVFKSLDEVDYVRERMDEALLAGMEKAGFVSFGFAEGGFALLMSNTLVTGLDDLKGRKVWMPEGDPVTYAAMETLGLSPVTLPMADVLTGLQTGLIEIIATSPVGAVVLQWHTTLKYVTDYPIAYLFGFMLIDKGVFDRLELQDQAVVRDVMGRIYRELDRINRADNEQAAEALRASGLDFVTPAIDEIEGWRERLAVTNRELAEQGLYSVDLLEQVETLLARFRDAQTVQADK